MRIPVVFIFTISLCSYSFFIERLKSLVKKSYGLIPTCHPDREFYAKDMCQSCYKKANAKQNVKPATCHPKRNAYAFGLCVNCHLIKKAEENEANGLMSACHPNRVEFTQGLCRSCYAGLQGRKGRVKGNHHTEQEWQDLLKTYPKCPRCNESWSATKPPTRDHIIPTSKGGNDEISNIQPLCLTCNQSKGKGTQDFRNLF